MNRMAITVAGLFFLFMGCGVLVYAGETAEGHKEEAEHKEEKAKPEEKPRPDSAISFVMNLPEVKNWQKYLESKNEGKSLSIWGEENMLVDGGECSGIAVAETDAKSDDVHVWVRFCVTPGGRILVESKPKDPADEITFLQYDDWKKRCKPTPHSPGAC